MTGVEAHKTVAQIAQKYAISPKTVYRNCSPASATPWPCERIGSRIRFSAENEAAIDEMVRSGGIPATAVIDTALLRQAGQRVLKARRAGLAA